MKKIYFIKFFGLTSILLSSLTTQIAPAKQPSHITLLKEMFTKVTIEKNEQAIPLYYDKDFELHTNGQTETYAEFLKMHHDIYLTPIQYQIRYDEKTLIEQGSKIAGRLFITTKRPHEAAREIEVILIAEYKNDKLYRLWELTYPDWSKMKAFQNNSQ